MIGFFRKPKALLSVRMGGQLVAEVTDKNLPAEILPTVPLSSNFPTLELIDRSGHEYRYDLTSAIAEGAAYGHFSIRVSERFTVEADCLLSATSAVPVAEFSRSEAKGIRFQPFYLPECVTDPSELVGRGLFFRGLHFPGVITPGNVSLLCICDRCRKSFRLQSFHAGFSSLVYFYCESGTHTLTVSSDTEGAPPLLSDVPNEQIVSFENRLPPCVSCSKSFHYYNPFRCAACGAPYIDFLRHPEDRKNEYYGNYLYGDTPQGYALPPPGQVP